jgi:hypothetical protein
VKHVQILIVMVLVLAGVIGWFALQWRRR